MTDLIPQRPVLEIGVSLAGAGAVDWVGRATIGGAITSTVATDVTIRGRVAATRGRTGSFLVTVPIRPPQGVWSAEVISDAGWGLGAGEAEVWVEAAALDRASMTFMHAEASAHVMLGNGPSGGLD
jgi:hypothetical protein